MAELVRIGNSKGIRIPKVIIEQAQLEEKELEFKVVDEGLLICPIRKKPRAGWEAIFTEQPQSDVPADDKEWIDAPLTDDEGWEW
ncbi:MAG: AbrB family transcriptional regulator [Gammaproteobacteria bacterium]|nr:MAG: AbrB family transcriptional regulator [Gammaproteobacteria bacterium]